MKFQYLVLWAVQKYMLNVRLTVHVVIKALLLEHCLLVLSFWSQRMLNWRNKFQKKTTESFGVEQIREDDRLVSFYTGFTLSVFGILKIFLGPAVDKLT